MNLSHPIVLDTPQIRRNDGTIRKPSQIILNELKITIIDDNKNKKCGVMIHPLPKMLTLWEGDDYDNIGDYSQAQAENRVVELLGDNPKLVLQTLFQNNINIS